jgi:hypothetical protein
MQQGIFAEKSLVAATWPNHIRLHCTHRWCEKRLRPGKHWFRASGMLSRSIRISATIVVPFSYSFHKLAFKILCFMRQHVSFIYETAIISVSHNDVPVCRVLVELADERVKIGLQTLVEKVHRRGLVGQENYVHVRLGMQRF